MHRIELKIPPVIVVFLLAWAWAWAWAWALAMWLVAEMSPWLIVQIPAKAWLVVVIRFVGCALIIAGAIAFITTKTTMNPLPQN